MKVQKLFKFSCAGLITLTSLMAMPQQAQAGFGISSFGIGSKSTKTTKGNNHRQKSNDFLKPALKATTILINNNNENDDCVNDEIDSSAAYSRLLGPGNINELNEYSSRTLINEEINLALNAFREGDTTPAEISTILRMYSWQAMHSRSYLPIELGCNNAETMRIRNMPEGEFLDFYSTEIYPVFEADFFLDMHIWLLGRQELQSLLEDIDVSRNEDLRLISPEYFELNPSAYESAIGSLIQYLEEVINSGRDITFARQIIQNKTYNHGS